MEDRVEAAGWKDGDDGMDEGQNPEGRVVPMSGDRSWVLIPIWHRPRSLIDLGLSLMRLIESNDEF